jgi:hypothetical protein
MAILKGYARVVKVMRQIARCLSSKEGKERASAPQPSGTPADLSEKKASSKTDAAKIYLSLGGGSDIPMDAGFSLLLQCRLTESLNPCFP